jgi:intron-binding protein aquarius
METSKTNRNFFLPQIRGCEIVDLRNEDGPTKTITVSLDPAQYIKDNTEFEQGHDSIYSSFQLLVRRKPKENNFKAELESIRQIIKEGCTVPDWIHNKLLGYFDPCLVPLESLMPNITTTLNFKDTFLDELHILDITKYIFDPWFCNKSIKKYILPPYRSNKSFSKMNSNKRSRIKIEACRKNPESYFYTDLFQYNKVRFTQVQLQAIISSLQLGLTMVIVL